MFAFSTKMGATPSFKYGMRAFGMFGVENRRDDRLVYGVQTVGLFDVSKKGGKKIQDHVALR